MKDPNQGQLFHMPDEPDDSPSGPFQSYSHDPKSLTHSMFHSAFPDAPAPKSARERANDRWYPKNDPESKAP